MNLCDANVWLALAIGVHEFHHSARRWLEDQTTRDGILICRLTQLDFLRLATTAAVYSGYGLEPLTNLEAWAAYQALVDDDRIALMADEPELVETRWWSLSARPAASPKLWADAYLAAFAIELGCRIVTTDSSFTQFEGLETLVLS